MAATTTDSRDFDIQVLEDTVLGAFANKNALMGSVLASQGAIVVDPAMPYGRDFIGNDVRVPYFGTIGAFADNAEDTAATPVALKMGSETSTVARSSLAFEVTTWARHSGPMDPYQECTRQIAVAAVREMDRLCLASAVGTSLVKDVHSSSVPVSLNYDLITDGRALYGDEDDDIVAMVVHSRVMADLRKLRDGEGRPLLLDSAKLGQLTTFGGIPIVQSDRMPLTGSTMSAVVETGATVGGVTLTGTPTGAWNLQIKIILGGARATATFQFSTDGGNTWSETLVTAASVPLIDTTADSLVGNNGATGLTAVFGVATYDVLSVYASNAILKATSLIMQKGSLAFWYAGAHMRLQTDKDILKDNDVAAMHMYRVAHRYRRRNGGSKPGIVALKHNVGGFTS